MKIIEKIFDSVLLLQPDGREDSRGTMQVLFSKKTMKELPDGFNITEQRIYKIPKKHTFFGIHYQKPEGARGKINLHERGLGGQHFVHDFLRFMNTFNYSIYQPCYNKSTN